MAKQLDVYRDWLGITETARPLNHYQLLRLKQFEDNPAKVREHYRKMNAHVRKYAAGDYAKQSQDLLNELARAMLCLTDSRRKIEYDASLGRERKTEGKRRTLEEILIAEKVIDTAGLDKARKFAAAVGVELRDAVLQQKVAKPEAVSVAFAESVGLPYLDLADIQIDPALASSVPAVLARQHSCVPVMIDDGQLLLASPNLIDPAVEEELRLRIGHPVRTVLCGSAALNELIGKFYSKEAALAEMAAGKSGRAPSATVAVGKPAAAGAKAGSSSSVDGAPAAKAGKSSKADQVVEAAAPARAPLTEEELAERRKRNAGIAFGVVYILILGLSLAGYAIRSVVVANLTGLVAGAVVGGLVFLLGGRSSS